MNGALMRYKQCGWCLFTKILVLNGVLYCSASGVLADRKPDIVIFVADDLGYSDIGCYGGEIHTPNIDGLAAEGLRFTQYYTGTLCSPTRSMLMTGHYHQRHFNNGRNITIPEGLAEAGYKSYACGKWHNQNDPDMNPLLRGFDHFFGTPAGCGSYFAPHNLTRDGKDASKEYEDKDFYYTDAISDSAIQYIQQTPDDTPMFLYVAYTAPHWPIHALPEDIAKYSGVYSKGWDDLREKRLEGMKKKGVIGADVELPPRDKQVPAWEHVKNKEVHAYRMEVYAAMVDRMDQGIGRIIQTLKEEDRFENTLILMMSDNGPDITEINKDFYKGVDWLNTETRDGRPVRVGNLPEINPGPEDTWQSVGWGWAHASSTPFRRYKAFPLEGGIRSPLIAHWPEVIREKGKVTSQIGHVTDLLPTILEIAGVEYPAKHDGKRILPSDGRSFLPILSGEVMGKREPMFWDFLQRGAIRDGEWKLVKEREKPWMLYNIESDPSESEDLTAAHPDQAALLLEKWTAIRDEINETRNRK